MIFTVKNNEGQAMMSTQYEECVPIENLDSMSNAGMTFYLDGRKISAANIREKFKGRKELMILKYESAPTIEDDAQETVEVTKIVEPETASVQKPHAEISEVDISKCPFAVTSRTVVCMNNGHFYRNQKEAAESLHIDINLVSYSILQGSEYKGYIFKKVQDLK